MKTSELKEIARKNGYEFSSDGIDILLGREIKVFGKSDNIIKIREFCVNRVWIKSGGYTDDADMNMMEVAMAYAKTPLGDREEPKRFYLKHKWLRWNSGKSKYLNRCLNDRNNDIYFLNSKQKFGFEQVQFTQKEINAIKKEFNTSLEDFEIR